MTPPPYDHAVRHATSDDLGPLTDVLTQLRELPGVEERKPGVFYRRRSAFCHFHADPSGLFADAKVDGEFVRFRVTTVRERARFLSVVRAAARG